HLADQLVADRLRPRVDRVPRHARPRGVPTRDLARRGPRDEAHELRDKPGGWYVVHEWHRVQTAPLGVLPADRAFDPGERAGAQVDLRLIQEKKLVTLERAAQLGLAEPHTLDEITPSAWRRRLRAASTRRR